MADVVMGTFECWGKGGFLGEHAQENTAKFANEDVVLEANAPTKNTDGYTTYKGHAGWKQWIQFLTNIEFGDFTPTVVGVKEDKVYVQATYNPTGAKNGVKVLPQTDVHIWTIKDNRVSHIKFYWDRVDELDKMFA